MKSFSRKSKSYFPLIQGSSLRHIFTSYTPMLRNAICLLIFSQLKTISTNNSIANNEDMTMTLAVFYINQQFPANFGIPFASFA